ncbi:MAG: carbohydrate binding family 9 domain-containing protein [Gemmatimonadaceae bacterium]|nr:carbohydrate binding family 9 domain-containing protein [Gemmatimonadaceae bacterium]
MTDLRLRMFLRLKWYVAIAILSVVDSAGAQASPKRALASRLASTPAPRIDGRLNDPAWAGLTPIEDFEQQRPIEGAAPSERTQVFIRYDDDALYVGARMFRQRPDHIARSVTRRDGQGNAERLQVTFDTHRDRRTAYAFEVSAAGVRNDFHHSQDDENRGRESQYDPVWSANAVVDSLGWTAEMRIPFSQVRFPTTEVQEWGFQMDRWMPDKNEDLQWIVIPSRENGYISRFGTLSGISGVKSSRPTEFLPYMAADATKSAVSNALNPFRNPTKARAGLDAKFGIGSNLTVDATVNPDFGQVEADPAEVNLSAFETIVEERRTFFTEGAQLLRVEGPNYFYSRRIGSAPHLSASGDFTDQPHASTILGAAKVTGRTRSRLSVGALAAVTGRTEARVFDLDSLSTNRVSVEPQAEYAVVRLQQEIGTQASTIGGSFTSMRRNMSDLPQLASVLSRDAMAGGIDWRIRMQQGRYAVSGWAGYSYVAGDSLAMARVQRSSAHFFQRPDGGYLGYNSALRSLKGYTASIRADKDAGRHILWGAQVMTESPGYEVNDVGRVQSSDDIEYNADIQVRETQPGPYFQNWRLGFATKGAYNYGGNHTNSELTQNTSLTFRNLWSLNVNSKVDLPTLDDALTRGGPLMSTALSAGQEVRINSPFGGRTFYRASANWNTDVMGGHRLTLGGSVTVRPAPRWQATLEPSYTTSTDARQYVTSVENAASTETYGRRYLFAYVDRVTASMKTRLNYAFSPSLTLEGYGEPFVASGHYYGIGELRAPRTHALKTYGTEGSSITRADDGSYAIADQGAPFTLSNRDFNVLSFRSNVVLRWEWNAGSTLFLVWQQNRRASEALGEPARFVDLRNTTRAGGDNYLAMKLSYWFPVGGH